MFQVCKSCGMHKRFSDQKHPNSNNKTRKTALTIDLTKEEDGLSSSEDSWLHGMQTSEQKQFKSNESNSSPTIDLTQEEVDLSSSEDSWLQEFRKNNRKPLTKKSVFHPVTTPNISQKRQASQNELDALLSGRRIPRNTKTLTSASRQQLSSPTLTSQRVQFSDLPQQPPWTIN
jgi:hypothetical protein